MTHRAFVAALDATSRRLYASARERWQSTRLLLSAWTGKEIDDLPEYPDYEGSEEEYDAEAIEEALSRHPLVIHVAAAPPPEAQPTQE